MLRHLEIAGLPAVTRGRPGRRRPSATAPSSITEYLAYSIQYRRLLMRFPLGPGPYRDRLLDAMASLLVDLHRAGVYWGDCSLANTLFRRDGDKIQAYLVDAETSEIHPALSDGQRAYDLDILVENVAFGLADLGAMQGRDDAFDDAVDAAETVRSRYTAVWDELHLEPELAPGDRHAIRARIRRLNDLGFAVDEISLEPTSPTGRRGAPPGRGRQPPVPRPRAPAADRARRPRGPGAPAAQRHPRVPGLDRVVDADHDHDRGRRRTLAGRGPPAGHRAARARRSGRCAIRVQAYCDVLEQKWLLSEAAGHDVGLEAAMARLPRARGARARGGRDPRRQLDRARHRLVERLRPGRGA